MFLLVGCSNSPKPETTVTKFIEAGKSFNFEQTAQFINSANPNNNDRFLKITKPDKEDMNNFQYFVDYFKDNAAKITYSIKSSTIEDDKATVSVDFKYINGGPLLKATVGEVFTKVLPLAFSGVEMKKEDMGPLFAAALKKQREVIPESFAEKTIDVKLIKLNNQWLINETSDELVDVFMSNFISAGKEIDKSMGSTSGSNQSSAVGKTKKTFISKAIGEEVVLATIKFKINSVEEKSVLTSKYGSSKTAKEGAKFIIINADITNITNAPINAPADLDVIDNKNRQFQPYSGSIGVVDNLLDYRNLSPSIKETGCWVYELPQDASSYKLVSGKMGTNEVYQVTLK
ncbi:DUF4352 domain-containing protein [Heliobacterium gestii]|uniref:DUF4352 domain-containing protein n=1 Tax=Heliomicrobium gestii TaxID=2699 RepID=A0A845L9J5_HELGE|nr:DUF4352 domain-containing protein [Heliomicrobium gestii]